MREEGFALVTVQNYTRGWAHALTLHESDVADYEWCQLDERARKPKGLVDHCELDAKDHDRRDWDCMGVVYMFVRYLRRRHKLISRQKYEEALKLRAERKRVDRQINALVSKQDDDFQN